MTGTGRRLGDSLDAGHAAPPAKRGVHLLLALALVGALLFLANPPAGAQQADTGANDPNAGAAGAGGDTCPGGGFDPVPVEVEVTAVPIVVQSTADEYFVLYVRHDLDRNTAVEFPVSITLGQDGTTTLSEQLTALPRERYRVEKFLIADPADVDGDCTDDITELADPVRMNPINPGVTIPLANGAARIPDRETFQRLAYQGEGGWETHLNNIEYVKFYLIDMDTDRPSVYFLNTSRHLRHDLFYAGILRPRGVYLTDPWHHPGMMEGIIAYFPDTSTSGGSSDVYRFEFALSDAFSFDEVAYAHTVLAANMPLLHDNLAYNPRFEAGGDRYEREQEIYDASRVYVLQEEINSGFRQAAFPFMLLNQAEGYGFLRVMSLEERPGPRDIVIYETLPNELSRVAGIITTVFQTPLSHVNLRAVQDGVPNAYIRDALEDDDIVDLIGTFVRFSVNRGGYSIRAATPEEVEAHYEASRPTEAQTPERDLTVTEITALGDIGFDDWDAFGVKAANVAVLGTLGFPEGTVPDGFAVPFYFYDEFMKHNGFYDDIEELLADPDFQSDFDIQASELKDLRKKIKKGESPAWMIEALEEMHAAWPEGQSLRYRSSTNNEDLPGFSGAGLYDSKTQKPDETTEDGIDKSLKQVYASLWNFRAFTEREFHRVDHSAAAMGVLVHPNFSDELANGVAASFDPLRNRYGSYYLNTQLGEDMVTNPEAHSVPEEIQLYPDGTHAVLAFSNQMPAGQRLMSDAQMEQLRGHLEVIHEEFGALYGVVDGESFAMEIEFKITSENVLSIKQARPWVFAPGASPPNHPATGVPVITGTAQVDQTLTADISGIADADGMDASTLEYQWTIGRWDIAGATGPSHTVAYAEQGRNIGLRVSFIDDRSNHETVTSAATAVVIGTLNRPATGLPAIVGEARAGETLTVDISAVADPDGIDASTLEYQWIRGGAEVAGATGSEYELSTDDGGETFRVRVSFTDDRFHPEAVTSAATAAVVYVDGAPVAPASVFADAGDTEIVVSWRPPPHANRAPVEGYLVRFGQVGGSKQELRTDELTHTLSGLTNGVAYEVQVLALNAAGDGDPSEEFSVTPQLGFSAAPAAPQNSTAAAVHHRRVALDWDDVPFAARYEVQLWLWTSDEVSGWPLDSASMLPRLDVFVEFDGSSAVVDRLPMSDRVGWWVFDVRAVNAGGVSDWAQDVPFVRWTDAADWAGVTVSAPASLAMDEGGQSSYTVVLDVEPAHSVTIDIAAGENLTLSSDSLTFTPENWDDPQTVTVTAVEDPDAEDAVGAITHSVAAASSREYLEKPVDGIEFTITDVTDPAGLPVWSATMTVGTGFEGSGFEGRGYSSSASAGFGALSETDFEVGDSDFTVSEFFVRNWSLGVAVDAREVLPYGFVLSVGDHEFSSADAVTQRLVGSMYEFRWSDPGLGWSDGDEVEVSLVLEQSELELGRGPLIGFTVVDAESQQAVGTLGRVSDGAVLALPVSQGGSYAIRADTTVLGIGSVRLELSGEVAVSRTENRAPYSLYGDANGALGGGALPAGSYTLKAAAYTGRNLGGEKRGELEVSFTVIAAQDAAAPLTASVSGVPASHDGQAFSFELEFSEHIDDLSYRTLKHHAFSVTGGRVTKAQRIDRHSATRNIGWRITVRPDGDGDVAVLLPVTANCDATWAICTADNRKLSNRLELTIPGPDAQTPQQDGAQSAPGPKK